MLYLSQDLSLYELRGNLVPWQGHQTGKLGKTVRGYCEDDIKSILKQIYLEWYQPSGKCSEDQTAEIQWNEISHNDQITW